MSEFELESVVEHASIQPPHPASPQGPLPCPSGLKPFSPSTDPCVVKGPTKWSFSAETNPGHAPWPPPGAPALRHHHIPHDDQLDEVQQFLLPLAGGAGLASPP